MMCPTILENCCCYDYDDVENDVGVRQSSNHNNDIIDQKDVIRIPIIDEHMKWYRYYCYCPSLFSTNAEPNQKRRIRRSRTTPSRVRVESDGLSSVLSDSTNNSDEEQKLVLQEMLSIISNHTWNEFWYDINTTADLLEILTRLDGWFWIILLPLFGLRALVQLLPVLSNDIMTSDQWDIIFLSSVFAVSIILISIDMYITYYILNGIDIDQKIYEICFQYHTKFQLQGYTIEYIKEYNNNNNKSSSSSWKYIICCFISDKSISRYICFRKLQKTNQNNQNTQKQHQPNLPINNQGLSYAVLI